MRKWTNGKLPILVLASFFSFPTIAQNSCPIKRAYSFYTVSVPGMIPVDDKGNPVQAVISIDRSVYLECSGGKMPVIDKILYDNSTMKTIISRIIGSTVIVGKHAENGHDFEITCRKGYTLWKVELYPEDQNHTIGQDCRNIIIKSRYAGRLCKLSLYKETRLMSLPRY